MPPIGVEVLFPRRFFVSELRVEKKPMQQGTRVLLRLIFFTFALVFSGLTSSTQAQDANLLR
ncbi:MAG: hypothetical protein ABI700_26250, partial [Chloroflexota bacterium]